MNLTGYLVHLIEMYYCPELMSPKTFPRYLSHLEKVSQTPKKVRTYRKVESKKKLLSYPLNNKNYKESV